jgi:hypothetical protein
MVVVLEAPDTVGIVVLPVNNATVVRQVRQAFGKRAAAPPVIA